MTHPRRPIDDQPIPRSLVQPAPLTLRCQVCNLLRPATAEGIIVFHLIDRWDEHRVCCPGEGMPGLPTDGGTP